MDAIPINSDNGNYLQSTVQISDIQETATVLPTDQSEDVQPGGSSTEPPQIKKKYVPPPPSMFQYNSDVLNSQRNVQRGMPNRYEQFLLGRGSQPTAAWDSNLRNSSMALNPTVNFPHQFSSSTAVPYMGFMNYPANQMGSQYPPDIVNSMFGQNYRQHQLIYNPQMQMNFNMYNMILNNPSFHPQNRRDPPNPLSGGPVAGASHHGLDDPSMENSMALDPFCM